MIAVAALIFFKTNMQTLPTPAVRAFAPSDVRIYDSPFKTAMEADLRYLLEIDPRRLLHNFYEHSGLPTRGAAYGGWEAMGIAGHTLGHYLSACSAMYASTADPRMKDRVDTIVAELVRCQAARKDGFVAGFPEADRVFAEIKAGKITSKGFDLNGLWVPWYTMHKLFAGLLDAHRLLKNQAALDVAQKLGDWAIDVTAGLDDAHWQKMLACEHGGMNEVLAELSDRTHDPKYMMLAKKFYHNAILEPLANQKAELAGKHGNTQIPKVIGAARIYELTGEPKFATIAKYFWDEVAHDHTYVTGGNTMGEYFGQPGKLNDRLSASTTETCNVYNMLKLTEHLFTWQPTVELGDFYERAMYNHILASQNHEDGQLCYFVPLESGHTKPFGTKFEDFTCCYGSGMENHAKYNEAIYFHDDRDLWVNLYLPSSVRWADRKLQVVAKTDFPVSGHVQYEIFGATPQTFAVHFRYPRWATSAVVRVNNKVMRFEAKQGEFIKIEREWKPGDKIDVRLGMAVRTESMPDNPKRVALFYGPTLLAGVLPERETRKTVILNPGDAPKLVRSTNRDQLRFRSVGFKPGNIDLVPFYAVQGEKYAVYFDRFTTLQWAESEANYRAAEAAAAELEKATVDRFDVGEMQPERDHDLKGENTASGTYNGRKWRHAENGGWFSWTMKVDPTMDNELRLTYWGSDAGGREFLVAIDNIEIAHEVFERNVPDKFYEKPYVLTKEFLAGRKTVTVRLQALPGKTAGGLYGARVVRK